MGKDTKIKQSVSSPPLKAWGEFFLKKALDGGTNFLRQICGGGGRGCFTWELIMRSCKGGVKVSQMTFPVI